MKPRTLLLAALFIASTASKPYLFAATDAPTAVSLPGAEEVMAQAKTKAAAEHKNILLVFSASWCGPCRLFEAFLRDPATGPIMDKYFVTARLDVGERPDDKRHSNSPGAEAFRSSLHGADAGYPFIVMLNSTGKVIVNSYRPVKGNGKGENIGYPALPVEIDWFMKMLQQAAPAFSSQETKTIQTWLQQRGHS
jgi:thiol-disulfide isomerase/thioredoxin